MDGSVFTNPHFYKKFFVQTLGKSRFLKCLKSSKYTEGHEEVMVRS